MIIRLCKTALVASVGFFLVLVVLNNVTDYGSNFAFVQHVLSMDTTFPGNKAMWRAMTSSVWHHAFYVSIILWETVSAVLILAGAARLWSARRSSEADFHSAKTLAAVGLTVNMLLWFLAFISVGGEWFLMWQSKIWNGQDAAFRMFACIGIILLLDRKSVV